MLKQDPIATAQFAEIALPLLRHEMQSRHGRVDADIIFDSCAEAILSLCQSPERWEPARSSIRTYLAMAATADLRNHLDRARLRAERESLVDPVDFEDFGRNIGAEGEIPEGDTNALVERYKHLLEDRGDQEVLRLMVIGERNEAAYAVALGISLLPASERKSGVKRAKDRVKKRLQRADVEWPVE